MRTRTKISAAILIVGAVGLAFFAVLTYDRVDSPPLGIGLQSYTNASAVFTITNLSRSQLNYFLIVERKVSKTWPVDKGGVSHIIDRQAGVLAPRQVATVTLPVMVYVPPYPWRLSAFCWKPPAQLHSARFKAALWLFRFHLPKLGQKLYGGNKLIQVSSPEVQQREN